jgi:hypothetical protein
MAMGGAERFDDAALPRVDPLLFRGYSRSIDTGAALCE